MLQKHGNKKTYFIHRLVAQHFIDNPNNYNIVNHKDENKLNNTASNLEWCTYKYNNTYGNRIKKTYKKVIQYDLQGNFISKWNGIIIAAEKLNISNQSICACCKGKRKTAGGYIWAYEDSI